MKSAKNDSNRLKPLDSDSEEEGFEIIRLNLLIVVNKKSEGENTNKAVTEKQSSIDNYFQVIFSVHQ